MIESQMTMQTLPTAAPKNHDKTSMFHNFKSVLASFGNKEQKMSSATKAVEEPPALLTFRLAFCEILPQPWLVQFQKSDGEWMIVTAKDSRPESEAAIATLRGFL